MGAAERRCRGCRDRAGRHLLPGGEVVDDDDVVVLCQGVGKVRADEAGPAGDDVAHEEFTLSAGLGLSEWCWRGGLPPPAFPHNYFIVSGPLAQLSPLSGYTDRCVRSGEE